MTERRKRVLLDARKARDFGIGTYIRGLLGGLAGLDRYEVHALVLPGEEGLLPPGVSTRTCAAPHYSLEELVAVRGAISSLKPDVFHSPHYVVPFFPPRATVATIHDLMHLTRAEHAAPAKRAYARWMVGRALRLSARVIAVSDATKKEILAFGPEWGGKVVVIPNGVREDFFEGGRGNARALRSGTALSPILPFKESLSDPYVLFLGNDKPHKNLGGLLAAFARLRVSSPAVSLVLAGVEPNRVKAEGVQCIGFVPDAEVPRLVAGARVLVLPSFAEGFGLPVIEAQAAGTPVACSDIPALREAAGDAAVFFDPHDAASIAAALNMLLGDEEKSDFLRKRGRERARGFTWDAVAVRTAAVYEDSLRRVSDAGAPPTAEAAHKPRPSPSYPFKEKTPSPEPKHDSPSEGARDSSS